MSVTVFYRLVRSQWQALTQLVWPADVEQLTQSEIARLTDELEGRYARLVRRRRKVEQLRDRLAALERAEPEPPSMSEHPLGRAIERNRARLAEHEEAYERQRRAFVRLKHLRRAMMRGQVVVCEDEREPEA